MMNLATRNVMTRFSGLKMAKKRSNAIAHSVKTETAIETGCAKPRSLQRTSPIDYLVVEKICWGGGGGGETRIDRFCYSVNSLVVVMCH